MVHLRREMKATIIPFLRSLLRTVRSVRTRNYFNRYKQLMELNHPLRDFRMVNIGDCSDDPTEFFSHYEAFSFWLASRLNSRGRRRKILDIGSTKCTNAILSVSHDVTAIVLKDCHDRLSNVKYVIHDVSDRLPFPDKSFDTFTSTASLHLVGLGRYGDRLDPNSLIHLIAELDRVMKDDSELIFSFCLGKDMLHFNNSWFLELDTIKKLFRSWCLKDYLVDNYSSPYSDMDLTAERYTKDTDTERIGYGSYRVIFLCFKRGNFDL